MSPSQLSFIANRLESTDTQSTLLGIWANGPRVDIPDPYATNDYYFEHCFEQIQEACHECFEKMTAS